jgi:hypothetical protein
MADVENNVAVEVSESQTYFERLNPEFKKETAQSAVDAARDDDHAGDENADETADKSALSENHAKEEHDEDEHDGEGQPNRKKGGFQRRIEKLNAKIAERDRQIAELAAKTAGAKADAPETKPTADAADQRPVKPEIGDETLGEYLAKLDAYNEQLADWKARQVLKADRAATAKADSDAKAKDALEAAQKTWNEREAIAKEQFADEEKDYEESTTDFIKRAQAGKVAVSQVMKDFVNDSEFGPQMLYAIANLPDAEVNKIAAMGTAAAARALTALEAQFAKTESATEEAPTQRTTQAPPPVNPVRRPAGSNKITDPMQAAMKGDFALYEKLMREKEKRER